MDSLIERLEAATEGSRELDAMITAVVGIQYADNPVMNFEDQIPHYTTSIDAAITLIPEEMEYRIAKNRGGELSSMPGIWFESEIMTYNLEIMEKGISRATAALAICIAALRFGQHEKEETP